MNINDSPYRDKHSENQAKVLAEQARAGDVLAAKQLLGNAMVALSHVVDGIETFVLRGFMRVVR